MKCDELIKYGMDDPTIGDDYEMYRVADVDAAIDELKREHHRERHEYIGMVAQLKDEINRKEAVEQRWFERYMEARVENVKLKRALWIARAEIARTSAWVFWNRKDDYNYNKWKKVERKCRAKAEQYK